MIDEITLVPTSRFGALLSAQRREQHLELAKLAESSGGSLTVRDLQQIERGRFQLDDDLTLQVADLYGLQPGSVMPERKELIVDFDHHFIDTSGKTMNLGSGDDKEVLSRYLTLVYSMRGQEPGTPLAFREKDLQTLSQVLELTYDTVEVVLNELIENHADELKDRGSVLREKLIIPGAGILVAALSVGSLVFVGASEVENNTQQPTDAVAMVDSATTSPEFVGFVADVHVDLGLRAESLIGYDWQAILPGWEINYEQSGGGLRAVTDRTTSEITMYIQADESPAVVAAALAHELGHAIDLTYFTDDQRFEWLEARGMPAVWWAGDGLNDFNVGSGDFAEAVAALWVGSPSYSEQGPFSETDLQLAENMIKSIKANQQIEVM